MKIYRIYKDITNKEAIEDVISELEQNTEYRFHAEEIDLETGKRERII